MVPPGALEKQDPHRFAITDPSRLGPFRIGKRDSSGLGTFLVDEMGTHPGMIEKLNIPE